MIASEAWIPADGLTLEPNALRAAMERSCCLALTAGPGSGKTEMLAQRADFLLCTGYCRYPKRILAISFKVDASKNLKERVERRCGSLLASRFDSYTFHAFAKRIIDLFRPVLTGVDALDIGYSIGDDRIFRKQIEFADLVPLAIQILENSRVSLNAVRQSYSDVFLDEFQDCTDQQYKLLKVAFMGTPIRLVAVGDTKQRIMGWAGAMEGIFKTFVKDFKAIPLSMYRNFRSEPKLLRMQNAIISTLDPASVMKDKGIKGSQGDILVKCCTDSLEEAEYIGDLISRWVRDNQEPIAGIAVLVSKQLDLYAHDLMVALRKRGIPFRNEQKMQDIIAEPAAQLLINYLSCLYGEREPKAWIGLMSQLALFSEDENWANRRNKFNALMGIQKKLIRSSEASTKWWEFAKAFLATIGIDTLSSLSPDYESKTRLDEVIQETKQRIEETLLMEPSMMNALGRFSADQAVRILTIHKSKGLEFDSVIIMAVENESFFGDIDEERCAFFVGVSRAKKRLVLTCANRRDRPPGYNRRWDIKRTRQEEFWRYATPSP
jgi:superfamily I DNA/RNA helicase